MTRPNNFAPVLFLIGLTISAAAQTDQTEFIRKMLDAPAPGPVNRYFYQEAADKFPESFYSKDKVPADDAPIEELIAYWSRQSANQSDLGFNIRPSETVVDRLLEAVNDEHRLLPQLLHIFPAEPEIAETIKSIYDEEIVKIGPESEYEEGEEYEYGEKPVPDTVFDAAELAAQAVRELRITDGSEPEDLNSYSLGEIRNWLRLRSIYFVDELLEKASAVRDRQEYVINQIELLALSRVDWDKAEPIAAKLLDDKYQPVSSTLALYAYYVNAIKAGDDRDKAKYRSLLQAVVEDKRAKPGARDLALDALLKEDQWDGLDDWYIRLLEDETLFELKVNGVTHSGLTTLILNSHPDKWAQTMIGLVGSRSLAVHNAAVRNLASVVGEGNKDVLRALLPWLSNPLWAREVANERSKLLMALAENVLPESVPGLLAVAANENESYRNIAIQALAKYRDPRAVPVLQAELADEANNYTREELVKALLACGAYGLTQQVSFLESYARFISESPDTVYESFYGEESRPTVNMLAGKVLSEFEEPEENLVRFALARIRTLERVDAALAKSLDSVVQSWKSPVLDLDRLETLDRGSADIEMVLRLLSKRKDLGSRFRNDVFALRARKGFPSGIAACLLDSPNEIIGTLHGGDLEARAAALACARLIKAKLPVADVGKFLNETDPLLALAAEKFLIADDSYEARNLVYARNPGKAIILGSRFAFEPESGGWETNQALDELFVSVNGEAYFPSDSPIIDRLEDKIRDEVRSDENLVAVYAFLENASSGHQYLRLYKDKAVFSWHEAEARFRERVVPQQDLELILKYIAENRIEDQTAILLDCHHGCPSREFVMVGRSGGRRIYLYSGYYIPPPMAGLQTIFKTLEKGDSKLRYWLEDKVAGLEIHLDEKGLTAKAVWGSGSDLRVLVHDDNFAAEIETELLKQDVADRKAVSDAISYEDDAERYYSEMSKMYKVQSQRRAQRRFEPYLWRSLVNGRLGGVSGQPADVFFIRENNAFPEVEYLEESEKLWNVRTRGAEFRTGDYEHAGIWKVESDGRASEVKAGPYGGLLVTPDGKWLIATVGNYGDTESRLVRINLANGRESPVRLPPGMSYVPIAYIKGQNKVLVFKGISQDAVEYGEYYLYELKKRYGSQYEAVTAKEYFLVDPVTGSYQKVKGEFRPLEQITYRDLQPASKAGEYWAAIYDAQRKMTSVGKYDTNSFAFTEVMAIPEISLSSMEVWVNDADARLYFVYEGHLLSLPMK